MAYDTANPPALQVQAVAGPQQWVYQSTHGTTEVAATGFFTDGSARGMKVGDQVVVVETDNSYATSIAHVTSVASTGVTVAAGSLTST
jgi:hypothetical protein